MFDLNSLNPEQRQAVIHKKGSLLLLAGAGSGKTRVITCRIAHLLHQGIPAEQILAVTFTNKAAREMRERVREMVGQAAAKGMMIATFHSLCVRILKVHIDRLGFKKNFSIYASADQQRLIKDLLRELSSESSSADADQVLWRISSAKNHLISADNYQASDQDPVSALVAAVYPRYQRALKAFNAVDFDDLLMFTVQLLEEHADLLEHYGSRFQYQMVDEYQDTNPVQYRLLKLLASAHGNLCVVGDDDQSIYAFRGADVANILDFEKDFPGTKVIKLEQNYRSSGNILAAANAVIKNNVKRKDKALWTASGSGAKIEYHLCEDSEDEARQVMERIHAEKYRHKLNYGDFAILYRTNSQSRAFEEQLRYENIPYVLIGGQQFFDRKEIKDVIAYLKVIQNPADEVNLLRILNYPKRGIGAGSIDRIIRHSADRGISLWKVLQQPQQVAEVKERTASACADFTTLIKRYQQRFKKPLRLLETLQELFVELKFADEIYRQEKDPQVARRRVENQEELLNSMSVYLDRTADPDLTGFLDRISLFDDDAPGKNDKESKLALDAVTLMSLHSSKGLEFPVVFLTGLEEGFLPHKKSIYETFDIDEERRLCYVGITRAQQQLFFSGAQQRRKYGKLEQREPSRFLSEIPEELIQKSAGEQKTNSTPEDEAASASSFFDNISQMFGD
ncbi:DNA helicase-2 / ATP-dependent DNA helicase PcrA [Desulfuromusa kysingii]|uniref:DNA 3'-5' helicase n=1 Tax=Desulfuromusa kysingii TaxID=37625 RepID=A0A1H3XCB1_9BACT|nr:UvrD-helicase domain-containing protein [Desulfuromusa kysingii]SDZ96581.1 DNA helicase-2 / ATP-dependent DNA helicase PcrA [Desulfuromusa kysingii]